MNEKFTNREVSWLSFNERVLQEAMDKKVPLVQRFRFLGIFSNNLDEFFRVRVASLKRMVDINSYVYSDEPPFEILTEIQKKVLILQKKFEFTFEALIKELVDHNIFMINETQLSDTHIKFLDDYYKEDILQNLAPIILSKKKEMPILKDKSIYLTIRGTIKNDQERTKFALIEVPRSAINRIIVLPEIDHKKYFILLEDVIRFYLPQIFSIFHFNKLEGYIFKITRDAELDIDNDLSKGIIDKMSKSLSKRKQGQPVRIIYDQNMPYEMYLFFVKKLKITDVDSIIRGGRYHNFKDFINFPNLGSPELEEPKIKALSHPDIILGESILDIIEKKDILLHYPFHDFSQFIDLLRDAAIDPSVIKIKTTIYRVAYDSKVINALINAAKNGKEVIVLVELQARFDEKSNIYWAQKLKEEGVKVIYGIPGLKIHSKITLIQKKKRTGRHRFAVIGTGNMHEGTAKVYTDVHLLTSNPEITEDVNNLFQFFENNYMHPQLEHLIISPYNSRKSFTKLVQFEINQAKEGKKAEIKIKINNIVDRDLINLLYTASQAGVNIIIMARSMCSVVPGIKGLSENISVISIVDKFLEHSRLLYFYHGGEELYFISSADWMIRNLDHRVEVTCPIYDKEIKKEFKEIFDITFNDNVKARIIDNQQENKYVKSTDKEYRSQYKMYEYYKEKSAKKKPGKQKSEK